MNCPNNLDCDIQFTYEDETNDRGVGVYFESWNTRIYYYDPDSSSHHPDCQPLTPEQITKLEDARTQQWVDEPWNWENDYVEI